MRKIYTKPQIAFEDFTLTTNIAAGCEEMTTTHTLNQCGIDFSGLKVFMNGMDGCGDIPVDNVGGDGQYGKLCYHVPEGYNVFNS